MKYVVVQSGGKQYRATSGDILELEHIDGEKEQKITFNEVLLYADGESVKIGTPYVDGMSVDAVIVDQFRGEKIRVAKFKAKARYRRVTGHRQSLTRVKVEGINDGLASKKEKKVTTAKE